MLYTHYCTVGKYSLINPSPLCFFGGGGVSGTRQLIKFFLASTCDFPSLPLSLPITLSSHLNQAISTLYPRPRSSFSELSISNSLFFFSFSGRGTLHHTSILSTYTYNPFFQYAEKRESKTRRGLKKKEKKTSFLVSAVFEPKHTYIYTSYIHT